MARFEVTLREPRCIFLESAGSYFAFSDGAEFYVKAHAAGVKYDQSARVFAGLLTHGRAWLHVNDKVAAALRATSSQNETPGKLIAPGSQSIVE